jgi:uncharacterized ferredoxin-like protein
MEIMKTVADLMALSAVTAPKAKGQDYIDVKVITDPSVLNNLADEMSKYSEESGKRGFQRDAANIRNSQALVLLSLKNAKHAGLNCGACGRPNCAMLEAVAQGPEFNGPLCPWRLIDLGIAVGSAVKTASTLNADNRIMYSAGATAKQIGLIEGDIAVAIPLNVSGKSIYFDR